MSLAMISRLAQNKRFEEVTKLVQSGFYKIGDYCDLPLLCPDMWTEYGDDWNTNICNPVNLTLVDQGNGTWKFRAFLV
jgi:hypothetical protein